MEVRRVRESALRIGAGAVLAAGGTGTAEVALAQDNDAILEGRVEVTGTRIKQADIEGALPVTVIDRERIELSGEISVADLLRNTNFNSFGSFRPQSGNTAQSFAGISLRGLGEGRTLVLVDGRRAPLAPFAGGGSTGGLGQDLNAIPLAAVERIEILSDGASAIYGTDAIGGVVNVITRKDFNGAEFAWGMGRPTRTGGDTDEASAIFGVSGVDSRVLAGISFNDRQIVWQRDRAWSRGGASAYANNFRVAIPHPGIAPGGHDPDDPTHWLVGPFLGHPDNGSVVPGGCDGPAYSTQAAPFGPVCLYDFTLVAADEAAVQNQSLFVRANHRIDDDWAVYMNAGVNRVKSFGRYAPVASTPWPTVLPFVGTTSPNHPANRGLADYDPDAPLFFQHRFSAAGPRDTSTDANNYGVLLGLQGALGTATVDVGARHSEYKFISLGRNFIVGSLAQAAIDDGRYDIYDPGGTPPAVIDGLSVTTNRDARFLQREAYITGTFDLFGLPGGVASSAVGVEYRDETFRDLHDSLKESNQVVGSAGNSAFGRRNASAAFFELLFPVLDPLEVNLAGRYDEYSDYGSDFSPKVSTRWQPHPRFVMRASWGEGFKAPSLDVLSLQPAFTAIGIQHPPTCAVVGLPPDCVTGVLTFVIGNQDLESESSEQYSAGFGWDATDWLDLTVDYFDITVENRVTFVPPFAVVGCLEGTLPLCPTGLTDFSDSLFVPPDASRGMGAAFGPSGQVLFVQNGHANVGKIETSGFDLQLRSQLDFSGWGRLSSHLAMTEVRSYSQNGGLEEVGTFSRPRYRGTLSTAWDYGDYQIAWNINYVHSTGSVAGLRARLGLDDEGLSHHLPSWTTHDLQFTFHAPWNGRLVVGVRNVADRDPVVDPGQGRGFDFNLYHGYGRVPYVRYRQVF